jgi:hypothetical protein
MKKLAFGLIGILILLGACQPDESPLDLAPVLRVESISPTNPKQFEDTITMVIFYEDANGDLGSEDPDENVLSVKDSRLNIPDFYHVKPLAPIGTEVSIQGTFEVNLRTAFLLGNGDSEEITFTVQIKDRAGNYSEAVVSPTITVVK